MLGLIAGTLAFLRARVAVNDCHALVRRLLPDTGGVDARAFRDIAVVRYDALGEMSGVCSFSVALLNTAGDGIVLTSINGRSEARSYVKVVEEGQSSETLSPEEYRAVRAARMGQGLNVSEPYRFGGGDDSADHDVESGGMVTSPVKSRTSPPVE